jgi:hypothetical protein
VLRVDALRKPGGMPCRHVVPDGGGCGIHPRRPGICRAYRCLWLQGGLDPDDRPDRLGAVLDVVTAGAETRLEIHEGRPGAFDASPRLQAIARRYRGGMPVRIHAAGGDRHADRPWRVLLPDGTEQRVDGDRITTLRDGHVVSERRLPWIERGVRRWMLAWRRRRLRRVDGGPGPGRSRG